MKILRNSKRLWMLRLQCLSEIARVFVCLDHGQKAARFSESCGFLLADIPAA
jgi:hypothetical protein